MALTIHKPYVLEKYLGKNFDLVTLALLSKEDKLTTQGILEIVKKEFEVLPLKHLVQAHLYGLTEKSYIGWNGTRRANREKIRQITGEGKDYLEIVYQVKRAGFYSIHPIDEIKIKKVNDEIVKRNLDEILLNMFSRQKANYSGGMLAEIQLRTGVLFSTGTIWCKRNNMKEKGMLTSQKDENHIDYKLTDKGKEHLELLKSARTEVDGYLGLIKEVKSSEFNPDQFIGDEFPSLTSHIEYATTSKKKTFI